MTETDLAVFGNGAVDAKALEANADVFSGFLRVLSACLKSDSGAYAVCPAYVFKADRLDSLSDLVGIEARVFADLAALLNRGDTVLCQNAVDFLDSSVVIFK